jgi:hypothetical protein
MTDLLTMTGTGQRAETFVFDLLDQHNNYQGTLDVLADQAPSIDNNINRAVKRQLSGLMLPPSVTADVNTLSDRVRAWMLLQDGTKWPLGVFLFADASRAEAAYVPGSIDGVTAPDVVGSITTGTLLDQLTTLDQGSRGVSAYPPGTSVAAAIALELAKANVEDPVVDPSSAVLAQWSTWKPNAKRLDIINGLCKLGGYYSPFFDNMGVCQVQLVPALDAVNPALTYDFPSTNVYRGTVVESDDLLKAPNSYVVINSSLTTTPVFGEWLVPSASPNSFAARGFYVVQEHDVQGVQTNAQANQAAKAIGQADYATYRWVNLETVIDPRHDTFTVVGWKGDKYREQSWGLTCRSGEHQKHEWRRIYSPTAADDIAETEGDA